MSLCLPVWDTTLLESEAKARGIARAEGHHQREVDLARSIARELAEGGREISADDVRAAMTKRYPHLMVGNLNWMGSVFRGSEWRAVGFVHSKTKGSHANRLCLWTLRGIA